MQNKEEGEYEYASYLNDSKAEHTAGHTEEAQLDQPLGAEGQEGNSAVIPVLPLCKVDSEGPCTRNVCFKGTGGHKDECRYGRKASGGSPRGHAGGNPVKPEDIVCTGASVLGGFFGSAGGPEGTVVGGAAAGLLCTIVY